MDALPSPGFPSHGFSSPTAKLDAMAEGVLALLRTARGLAGGGRRVDLAGLDDMVGVLCAQTLDLPLADGRRFGAKLQRIDAELDLLKLALPPPA